MNENDNNLKMTFDPKVIEHLGVRMYSTLPPVLSELIANSYDADSKKVAVELHDEVKKEIVVKDDGIGMSFDDIQNKFLVVGRNRRVDENFKLTAKGRKPIGKKGLGKLSFFGVVKTITVDTINSGTRNVFVMDWGELMGSDGNYLVDHKVKNKPTRRGHGTTITLTNIKRKGIFSDVDIANSISRFFIFDTEFSVTVKRNQIRRITVTNKMRFELLNPEFEWKIPNDLKKLKQFLYLEKFSIRGKVITSKEPIRPSVNARGVTLFSRKKLVQSPYQFAESTSSHFFSYLSGWLEVDFIDDVEEDVIATNRQSLNWEHPDMSELHSNLQRCMSHIQKEWRKKRNENKAKIFDKRAPDEWIRSMPKPMRVEVENFLQKLESLSSAKEEEVRDIFDILPKIIPVYPYYHWRHLHESLKDPLIDMYKNKQYLDAARDGEQIYEDEVEGKAQEKTSGVDLFNLVFSNNKPVLEIQSPFTKKQTKENIQKGQRSLSVGLVESFRNPISHNTRSRSRKFFSENDCLDVLSLISFLLRRTDNSKRLKPTKKARKK